MRKALHSFFLGLALCGAVGILQPRSAEAMPETCKKLIAGAAVAIGLSLGSWGYYNWQPADGQWSNAGTESSPVWVPQVGSSFHIGERVTLLTVPRERTLWVSSAGQGFGRIFFRRDRIEYYRGDTLVAESGVVSPYGRAFDSDHPINVCVFDSAHRKVGTIIEKSEEISPGVHKVSFIIQNEKDQVVAESSDFEETDLSVRTSGEWEIAFPQDSSRLTRNGWKIKNYTWSLGETAESSVDPRLRIFLSALRSYVEEYRR